MSVERMPDERLTHFYENIRKQVEADRVHKHQFMENPTVRQAAMQALLLVAEHRLSSRLGRTRAASWECPHSSHLGSLRSRRDSLELRLQSDKIDEIGGQLGNVKRSRAL